MPFRNSVPIQEVAPGLVDILSDVEDISITEGDVDLEQDNPLRVYTWVAQWKRFAELHIALFLYQGGKRRDNRLITDIFKVRNRNIRSATAEDLRKINMQPEYCHSFPSWELVKDGTITHLVMDTSLYEIPTNGVFAIYGSTGRLATAQMSPRTYLDSVRQLTSGGVGQVLSTYFTE